MTIMSLIVCYYLSYLFLYISSATSETLVFFLPAVTHQMVAEGNTINLTCVYQADDIPVSELQLRRNGQVLEGFKLTQKGSTTPPFNKTINGLKTNASCDNDGQYTCSYETKKSFQNISIIKVVRSNSTISHTGGDAVLQCELQGCSDVRNFTMDVSWSHDGKSLIANEKYNFMQNGSLVIKNADYSDLGPYKCKIVLFHGGEDEDKLIFPIVNVDLQGPPKVTIEGNKEIYVCENHPVRVLCKTEGFPKPEVVWEARLENASNEIPDLQEGNELNFVTFKSVNEGNYTCVATSFMFPQVKVKDSIRIFLDRKRHCESGKENMNLQIIIPASIGGAVAVLVVFGVLIICLRRKGICKKSDNQAQSSFTKNEVDSSKEVYIQLEPKSSTNQHNSAYEPLLQERTTKDERLPANPPPKPPRLVK